MAMNPHVQHSLLLFRKLGPFHTRIIRANSSRECVFTLTRVIR